MKIETAPYTQHARCVTARRRNWRRVSPEAGWSACTTRKRTAGLLGAAIFAWSRCQVVRGFSMRQLLGQLLQEYLIRQHVPVSCLTSSHALPGQGTEKHRVRDVIAQERAFAQPCSSCAPLWGWAYLRGAKSTSKRGGAVFGKRMFTKQNLEGNHENKSMPSLEKPNVVFARPAVLS